MKGLKKRVIAALASLSLVPQPMQSCTVMQLNQSSHIYHAKNLDWPSQTGVLVLSPRHKHRQAKLNDKADQAYKWDSLYGSAIIHGKKGKTLGPTADGLNEKGLAVSALIWMRSKYPNQPNKPALDSGHVVQYLLDTASTVEEALHQLYDLNIKEGQFQGAPMRLHYFLSDKSGDNAVVEYINGKLHVTKSHARPLLTNDRYDDSQDYLKEYKGFGGTKPLPGGYSSKARYVRAATFLLRFPAHQVNFHEMLGLSFDALNDVAQPPYVSMTTEYTAVFDLTATTLYFKTVNNPFVRYLSFKDIDFSKEALSCRFDVFAQKAGNLIKTPQPCLG